MADGIVRIPLSSFLGAEVNAILIDGIRTAISRVFAERHIRTIDRIALASSIAELRRLTNNPSRRERAARGEDIGIG